MNSEYECDGCGACCRTKLVDVFGVDVLREPRVGQAMQPLREPGLDGEIRYLSCLSDGACPFLNAEHCCGIYPTRPSVCVAFSAGSEECQEARHLLELPPLEPIVKPQS